MCTYATHMRGKRKGRRKKRRRGRERGGGDGGRKGQLRIMEHHRWAVHLIFTSILIGHHCPMTMVLGEMLKSRNSNRILGNEFLQAMLYSDTWNEIQDHGFSETWCPLCVCVSLYVSVWDSMCVWPCVLVWVCVYASLGNPTFKNAFASFLPPSSLPLFSFFWQGPTMYPHLTSNLLSYCL